MSDTLIPGMQGKLTTIAHKASGDMDFTTIGSVNTIGGVAIGNNPVETTPLGANNKQYLPTITDSAGEVTLGITWNPADAVHTLIPPAVIAGTFFTYQITWPAAIGAGYSDGAAETWTFQGFYSGFEPSGMEPGSVITANVKIRSIGDLTMATVGS